MKINKLEKKISNLKKARADKLSENMLKMETGLPNFQIFNIIVEYAKRFKSNINYRFSWKVEIIPFKDQILLTLMKLRQNYTFQHLAMIFNCCGSTVDCIERH